MHIYTFISINTKPITKHIWCINFKYSRFKRKRAGWSDGDEKCETCVYFTVLKLRKSVSASHWHHSAVVTPSAREVRRGKGANAVNTDECLRNYSRPRSVIIMIMSERATLNRIFMAAKGDFRKPRQCFTLMLMAVVKSTATTTTMAT